MGYGHLSAHKCKDDDATFPLKKPEKTISELDLRAIYSQVLTIEEAPAGNEKLPEIEAATNENKEEEEDESEDEEEELAGLRKQTSGGYLTTTSSLYTEIAGYFYWKNIDQCLSPDKLFLYPDTNRCIMFCTIRI
ncbi:MAG: hypothetical protein J7497_02535 [Chitinophagaceae bacterium]|nr:hypothetical protein [Chitinophagaceae bacterium]